MATYQQNIRVLDNLSMDEHLNAETGYGAPSLMKELEKLENDSTSNTARYSTKV